VKPHKKFMAEAYILTKEEGGRHTPFFNNYRPQFYFRTTDVTGIVTLKQGTEMVMPGDNAEFTVDLIQPIAMEEKVRFAIREGGRTVGGDGGEGSLCHPRGRPHRRRRRRHQNYRVEREIPLSTGRPGIGSLSRKICGFGLVQVR
jgi:hypothetical protein